MAMVFTPIDAARACRALPLRPADAHKGSLGRVGLLVGSLRYRGAAVLAAHGALRSGAGLVQLAAIEPVCAAAAAQLPGCLLLPVPQGAADGPAPVAAGLLLAQGPTAGLAGCGLGAGADTAALVKKLLAEATCPLVLDADALNVLAGHLEGTVPDAALSKTMAHALGAAADPVVLTPHVGEMARLCGLCLQEIKTQGPAIAQEYALAHRCIVVLKSHHTVVAAPGGALYLYEGDNPGLAKGGSGDVLAGLIAGLLAQGAAPEDAAVAAVWLHGRAGRLAAQAMGTRAMLPAELPLFIGPAFMELE